jgi:NAD(P)H-hydrate epimerase
MLVLSAAEMQACDRATTERFGIPSVDLMRNAARSVADFARQQFPRARRVMVLCGRGNNGGDGMMAARLLADAGLAVAVILLGSPDAMKGDAAVAWRELKAAGSCTIHIVNAAEELGAHNDALATDLIIDAVVGTGFKPPLQGLALAALEWVKRGIGQTEIPVLAVDLPSGWPADETKAAVNDPVFPADAVVTFTAPKPAHVFGQLTRAWDQPVIVAPIGSPDEAIVSDLLIDWAGSAQALLHAPRNADANKGRFGHVLVVGGSFGPEGGKAGAPAMAALAAMRVGAGLVTAAVPAPALAVVSSHAPELMTWPLRANDAGQASPENLEPGRIEALTKGMTVLAIGPGLGQSDDIARFCIGLLEATLMPVLIDADALNILAKQPNVLSELTRNGRTVVITPHPGEMARLAGMTTADVQANRLEMARDFARDHAVTVVLKGARTLIAHPDGRVAVNTTGNPGMAKGGSGDLLTGMVAGLLAQYPGDPRRAVEAAVFLHGLAADLAVTNADEHTLLATDSLRYFSQAFRFRSRTANGYVWLQGLPGGLFRRESGSREAAE